MRRCCPICLEDTCPEVRPDCRARAEQLRAVYAAANGFVRALEPAIAATGAIARRLAREMTRLRSKGGAR